MIHVSLLIHPEVSVGSLSRLSHQLRPHLAPIWETYGTEALRLSPDLTSKDWQRCPTHFPYSKFFSLLSLPSVLFFSSCQRLVCSYRLPSFLFFSVLLALAGGSPVSESSFQSWQGPRLCAGCRGHYSSLLPPFTLWSKAEVRLLNHTAAMGVLYSILYQPCIRKSRIRSFCLKGIISCSSDTRRKG